MFTGHSGIWLDFSSSSWPILAMRTSSIRSQTSESPFCLKLQQNFTKIQIHFNFYPPCDLLEGGPVAIPDP